MAYTYASWYTTIQVRWQNWPLTQCRMCCLLLKTYHTYNWSGSTVIRFLKWLSGYGRLIFFLGIIWSQFPHATCTNCSASISISRRCRKRGTCTNFRPHLIQQDACWLHLGWRSWFVLQGWRMASNSFDEQGRTYKHTFQVPESERKNLIYASWLRWHSSNNCALESSHQEKYSKIMIDYKAVTKAGMTGIRCNWLAEVDIGSNPIIIVLQPSKFIVTNVIFPLIALVIIMLQFYYHVPILTWIPVTNRKRRCGIFKPTVHRSVKAYHRSVKACHRSVRAHCPTATSNSHSWSTPPIPNNHQLPDSDTATGWQRNNAHKGMPQTVRTWGFTCNGKAAVSPHDRTML